MLSKGTGEDALLRTLTGRGSRKGKTWFGKAGDITQRPAVWAGVAAALALAGGSRGRQAALRGGVGYTVAALAHLPVKAAVGRSHPEGASLLNLGPFTSSFPSGHAASDVAFVLSVSQVLPSLLLPLSGATLAGHWTLMRKRAHYPSDILAGGTLGVGVALVLWKLWPTRRADGRNGAQECRSDHQNGVAPAAEPLLAGTTTGRPSAETTRTSAPK